MEQARSAARRRGRGWLPWGLLAGVGVLAAGAGVLASRSLSALLERNAQLEREALESEERVAELRVLRASMERRLRLLEQHQAAPASGREAEARRPREAEALLLRREAARLSLVERLKEELARGEAWVDAVGTEALRVELAERLLFEPGQSTLTARGAELLARVGAVLASVEGHAVEAASHTDELPAAAGPAGTSWELSAARAAALARALHEGPARLAPERLSATGYASFRPAVPADSPQGRQRNRRASLLLVPLSPAAPRLTATSPPPAWPPPPTAGAGHKLSGPR